MSVSLSLCLSLFFSDSMDGAGHSWTRAFHGKSDADWRCPDTRRRSTTGSSILDIGGRASRLLSSSSFLFFFDFMWFFVLFWWPSSLSFFFFLYLPVPCSAGSLSLLGPLVWFDPESIRALCGAVKNFSAVLLRRRSNPVKPVESHFQTWNTTMSNPVEAVVGVARSKTDCFLVWKGNFWQKKHWKERNDWRLRQFQLNFVYGCHFLHVFNRKKLRNRFLKKRHPTYP